MPCLVIAPSGAPPFAPSGMYKTSDSANLTSSFAQIPGWTPDTGPYPGSSVVSNGLIIQNTRGGILVAASILMANASAASVTGTVQLKHGSTVIATSSAVTLGSFGGTGTATCSAIVDVAALDAIYLEARCSSGSVVVKAGSANSWVRATLP